MKRLLIVLAALTLIAATPAETIPDLEASGFYIEDGAGASEQVVSDAVSDGRADGGRLYIVVLADEPPGGATTFADSVLDDLGSGYVLVVGPQTVGYAADGTEWSREEMDIAVDASLDGGTDDEVIQIFIDTLTTTEAPPNQGTSGGGISIWWIILIGGGLFAVWWLYTNRKNSKRAAGRIEQVRQVAREKLDEVANDILEMEDEIATSDNAEAKGHYQRASAMYAQAMDDTAKATTVAAMVEVSEELDLAIWELDCAEALLDGKPKPPKPAPPKVEPPKPVPQQPTSPMPPSPHDFNRRPQRQSTGSQDMMAMLMTMMAMGGMRGGGGFGRGGGNWTGSGGGAPRPPMGGGGRFRGGGRRRG